MFSTSCYKTGLPLILFLAVQPLHSGAYASSPTGAEQPEKEFGTSYNPRNSLAYDQIVARIPLGHASTGAVALANLNIALHKAKQQAETTLCNGQWAPHGSVVFRQGPVIGPSSTHTDESPSWHYNAFRRPQELTCGTTSRAAFFLEMSRYLPAWVQIRPAGQLTAYQQGETVPPEQDTVAIK